MKKDPVWYSNYNTIALGVVLVAIAVIFLCQNFEVTQLLPYLLTAFMILLFVISFAFFAFRKKQKINKNPLFALTLMTYLLIILMGALPIITRLEKEKAPDWYFAIFFLAMSMSIVHAVFKHQQKRIDALEEKLNNQNQPKE